MPLDLSSTLIVGISSTSLFDLSEADTVFREQGIAAYRKYMLERESDPLASGTAFPLVRALLSLNQHASNGAAPLVEVVVMSHNSPETGVRILNAVRAHGLGISRFAFTGGEPLADYIPAFGIDLFLSMTEVDVQRVTDRHVCAAALLYPPPTGYEPPADQVRIAFDADAALFSEEGEVVYKTKGLSEFHRVENEASKSPLSEGPHARFLKKLGLMQERIPGPVEYSPVRLAVVTARNAPAELRVIATLRHWGVYVDAAFFLGGMAKGPILRALRPHIFFDDQETHVEPASHIVPAGRVPYPRESPLYSGNSPESQPARADIPLNRSPADAADAPGGSSSPIDPLTG